MPTRDLPESHVVSQNAARGYSPGARCRPKFPFDFICDGIFTKLDSNLGLVDVINPKSENKELVLVHQRIWVNANKKQRHIQFLESEHYANFQRENNNATVGYDVWRKVVKKVGSRFVSNPISQSCVDIKIYGNQNTMSARVGVVRKEHVEEELAKFCHPTAHMAAAAAAAQRRSRIGKAPTYYLAS